MTEDKRKKIITGCIIAGMVVLIIVLTTAILKVKKNKSENCRQDRSVGIQLI